MVDAVVYKAGDLTQTGWIGPAVQPYTNGFFGVEGQILFRKPIQSTGQLVPDTDTAADWAQATDDDINGKRIAYPGWSRETFFQTRNVNEPGEVRILVAPDHLFEHVRAIIDAATRSIDITAYTLSHPDLVDAIVARQAAGVTVRVLLEGEPVSGISDHERWAAQQIERAGGQVYFMHTDPTLGVHDRYTFQHAKFLIVDDATVLVGSEDFGQTGMPADTKADGTVGNRGAALVLTAPTAVSHFRSIFADDLDPANHEDLFRWTPVHLNFGAPPVGFEPDRTSGGTAYDIVKNNPYQAAGPVPVEIIQCPENCLRDTDALLGLISRAGPGDTVLVQQLYERKYWGHAASTTLTDPNPRLEAYIAAARRGARVRILLDRYYDDPSAPRSNTATAGYVNQIATASGLDMLARLGNPTGTGIHNKMVLASIAGVGYAHIGSINGSENSHKNNREVAVQIQDTGAYFYLEDVFTGDWTIAGEALPEDVPPSAPTGLTAAQVGSELAVSLDWADSQESDWSRYKVYVSTVAGGPYDFVATPTLSTYVHVGRANNTTYHYVVTAVNNADNESARSNQASVLLASAVALTVSGPASMEPGQTAQFTATATFGEGSQRSVTPLASWTSSNTVVATVTAGGNVTAGQAGVTNIRATVDGVSDQVSLTVTNPTPPPADPTPAPPTDPPPPVQVFRVCADMRAAGWTRGVNQNGGTYQAAWNSAERRTYSLNTSRDRDKDGHACET